jgi:Fe-S-cluster containining protein
MVVESNNTNQLIAKVAEIYDWLDWQIRENANAGQCNACGACCDFESFDHHLFVTTPELVYLAAKLGVENIKQMHTGRCPYNIDGKCSIYEYRFAGCRIFYCKGSKDIQSTLSESTLKKFKSLCTQLNIPYQYNKLAAALNSFVAIPYGTYLSIGKGTFPCGVRRSMYFAPPVSEPNSL